MKKPRSVVCLNFPLSRFTEWRAQEDGKVSLTIDGGRTLTFTQFEVRRLAKLFAHAVRKQKGAK